MSVVPSPERSIEDKANQIVDEALRKFDNGSFALFKYGCNTYAGVSQPLTVLDGMVLVRITKLSSPVNFALLEPLKKRCRGIVFEAADSLEIHNRNLFYARLHEGILSSLNEREQRYLIGNNLF